MHNFIGKLSQTPEKYALILVMGAYEMETNNISKGDLFFKPYKPIKPVISLPTFYHGVVMSNGIGTIWVKNFWDFRRYNPEHANIHSVRWGLSDLRSYLNLQPDLLLLLVWFGFFLNSFCHFHYILVLLENTTNSLSWLTFTPFNASSTVQTGSEGLLTTLSYFNILAKSFHFLCNKERILIKEP